MVVPDFGTDRSQWSSASMANSSVPCLSVSLLLDDAPILFFSTFPFFISPNLLNFFPLYFFFSITPLRSGLPFLHRSRYVFSRKGKDRFVGFGHDLFVFLLPDLSPFALPRHLFSYFPVSSKSVYLFCVLVTTNLLGDSDRIPSILILSSSNFHLCFSLLCFSFCWDLRLRSLIEPRVLSGGLRRL